MDNSWSIICHVARTAGVEYEHNGDACIINEIVHQVHEWLYILSYGRGVVIPQTLLKLIRHTKQINDCLIENGDDSTLKIDTIHGMTPLLHMLLMNPHASADSIAALLDYNMEALLRLDNEEKTHSTW